MSPADPNYEARVRASFAKQQFMVTLGANLASVQPGEVCIELPFRADLTQQHGFLHAGVVTSVIDSACGYAALTLMPPDRAVLSVEFKVNLIAPAQGATFQARGRVVRAGRTLTVCTGDLRVVGSDSVVAMMQATMMAVEGRTDRRD
ncbi:MAG TPA: PaaI family thioesterase [Gemmatimonadaceae bacterium]|nr:PaaI family thioesterase [Gemmatimonadaceae bacterium]